ncbi:MAG: hypothetical protein M1839_003042 [Geoglossum umbratile]|nr:MAG: hypothetical protein M1839_003042 [Geoglossum umbratile]
MFAWRLHEIRAHTVELAEPFHGEIHESAGLQGQGRAPEDKVGRQLPTGTAGDTRTCPLCLLPGVTAAHVGAHLQRIAIFALPLIQHSGKTDGADDQDSNEALGSAHASSTTTTLYSGRDSDQPLAQGSSINQDGGETSRLRLDDLIAQGEAAKLDIMSRYLDAEESVDEPSSIFELSSELLPLCENFLSNPPSDPKAREKEYQRLVDKLILKRENYSHGTLLDFYYWRGTLHLLF